MASSKNKVRTWGSYVRAYGGRGGTDQDAQACWEALVTEGRIPKSWERDPIRMFFVKGSDASRYHPHTVGGCLSIAKRIDRAMALEEQLKQAFPLSGARQSRMPVDRMYWVQAPWDGVLELSRLSTPFQRQLSHRDLYVVESARALYEFEFEFPDDDRVESPDEDDDLGSRPRSLGDDVVG